MLFSRLRLFKQIVGIVLRRDLQFLFVLKLLDCCRFAGLLSHGGKIRSAPPSTPGGTLGETLTVDRRESFTIPTNWRPNGRQDFQDSMRKQARMHGDGGIDAGTNDPIGHPYRTTRNYVVDGPVGFRRVDER